MVCVECRRSFGGTKPGEETSKSCGETETVAMDQARECRIELYDFRELARLRALSVPSVHRPMDERGDPKHFNNTFASGWC